MYEYRCEVVRVVDGDSVEVDIDLGFDVWLRRQSVRLSGIDAPELRSKDPDERGRANAARTALFGLLHAGETFRPRATLRCERYDASEKFGRILGRLVTPDGADCAAVLLERGLVRPYDGGPR